ncbi:MAG: enoyl-CoA hydratase [Aestuariivirga sp.]|nr:enoyl-CoA hydratase [Aestuariivirga sp.]
MNDLVLRDLNDGILRLTLNDPATRNSLSEKMIDTLQTAINGAEARVIILSAHGPAFSSGHNLKEITARRNDADEGRRFFKDLFDKCAGLMLAITHSPCPVIAEVDGLASAAGCQLVASCDLAVATDRATFCTPGVNIGLFCSTPMVALTRTVTRKHAMEMLLTGDVIPASEALRMGLVNRVTTHNELKAVTQDLAQKIASKSGAAIKVGKQAFDRQADMPVAEAYAYMAQVMADNLLLADAHEGIGAFIQKRNPKWEQDT